MSKELCLGCKSWNKCFYEGVSKKTLEEAIEYGQGAKCPQFADHLANVSLAEQVVLATSFNEIGIEEQIQEEQPINEPILLVNGNSEKANKVSTPILNEKQTERKIIYISNNKTKEPEDNFMKENHSGKIVPLREYINIDEFLEGAGLEPRFEEPFRYILKAIDKAKNYPQDLSNRRRDTLNEEIQKILDRHNIRVETLEDVRFFKALAGVIQLWITNTRERTPVDLNDPDTK